MSESKESRHHQRNRRLVDKICAKMEQVMDSKFRALRQEIQHLGPGQVQHAPMMESKPSTTNQKICDDLDKQIQETFKALDKGKKKRFMPQPSSEVETCLKEDHAIQSQDLEQPTIQEPETCQRILKQPTRGNYLESQKRMKPDLLAIGTGQTISTLVKWREYDADSKPSIYPGNFLFVQLESANQVYGKQVPNDLHHEWMLAIMNQAKDTDPEYAKVSIHDSKDPFIFDHTDIIRLSMPKEPNTGLRSALKCPRRIQKWEEDKRFKPPDLNQDKHQNVSFFMLIKEAPPDALYKPKPSQNPFRGMSLILHNPLSTNLPYVFADGLDLRTNPFQVGGDDVILASTKEMQHGPELEPAPDWPLTRKRTHARTHERTHVLIWAIDF